MSPSVPRTIDELFSSPSPWLQGEGPHAEMVLSTRIRLARNLPWPPEIIHLHDWQVGLVPLLIQHERMTAGWGTVVPRLVPGRFQQASGPAAPAHPRRIFFRPPARPAGSG